MKKPIFINSDEILLVMSMDEGDNLAQSGPFHEESDIINFINEADNAVKIFRIEPTTNRCEDISEEIAECYIQKYEQRCFEETKLHDFILHSDAYDFFLEDIKRREYEDAEYGSYEKQHRLRPCDVL
ncbi:hypothetical protein ABID39_001523 [Bartonella japonica]|uniref:Acetyltransferase n=1 Tax=Bartonella japonica TaxID=357761 RepID=A0ABV2FQF5_9HYPH